MHLKATAGVSTIVEARGWRGPDDVVIIQRHDLPPHDVIGRVVLRSPAEARRLREALDLHVADWPVSPRGAAKP